MRPYRPLPKAHILLVWIGGSWGGLALAHEVLSAPRWLIAAFALANVLVTVALVLQLPPDRPRRPA